MIVLIFVEERSLDPPPYLAATDLNKQVEDVLTILKFIAHKKIVFRFFDHMTLVKLYNSIGHQTKSDLSEEW